MSMVWLISPPKGTMACSGQQVPTTMLLQQWDVISIPFHQRTMQKDMKTMPSCKLWNQIPKGRGLHMDSSHEGNQQEPLQRDQQHSRRDAEKTHRVIPTGPLKSFLAGAGQHRPDQVSKEGRGHHMQTTTTSHPIPADRVTKSFAEGLTMGLQVASMQGNAFRRGQPNRSESSELSPIAISDDSKDDMSPEVVKESDDAAMPEVTSAHQGHYHQNRYPPAEKTIDDASIQQRLRPIITTTVSPACN